MNSHPDAFMPLWIADYLADTTHLTCEQHGAYLLLLITYWRRGGYMPADNAFLCAVTKLSPQKWRTMRLVMGQFFREEGGQWKNKRADAEILKAAVLKKSKAAAGKKGAENRWLGHGSAIVLPSESTEKTMAKNGPSPSPSVSKKEEPEPKKALADKPPSLTSINETSSVSKQVPEPPPQVSASPTPIDVTKAIWGGGLAYLTGAGVSADHARAMLGKWRKVNGDLAVLTALSTAQGDCVSDPIPYVQRILQNSAKGKSNGADKGQHGKSASSVFLEGYLDERAKRIERESSRH